MYASVRSTAYVRATPSPVGRPYVPEVSKRAEVSKVGGGNYVAGEVVAGTLAVELAKAIADVTAGLVVGHELLGLETVGAGIAHVNTGHDAGGDSKELQSAASQRAEAVHARDNRQIKANRQINSACGLLHLGNISTRSNRQPAQSPAEVAHCCVLSAGQGASSTCRIYIFICFPEASLQAQKSLPFTCTTSSALLSLLSHPPTHICSLSVQSQQVWLRSEQSSSDFTWNCAHKPTSVKDLERLCALKCKLRIALRGR